eukprot:2531525-Rhodomonas_salina.2
MQLQHSSTVSAATLCYASTELRPCRTWHSASQALRSALAAYAMPVPHVLRARWPRPAYAIPVPQPVAPSAMPVPYLAAHEEIKCKTKRAPYSLYQTSVSPPLISRCTWCSHSPSSCSCSSASCTLPWVARARSRPDMGQRNCRAVGRSMRGTVGHRAVGQ